MLPREQQAVPARRQGWQPAAPRFGALFGVPAWPQAYSPALNLLPSSQREQGLDWAWSCCEVLWRGRAASSSTVPLSVKPLPLFSCRFAPSGGTGQLRALASVGAVVHVLGIESVAGRRSILLLLHEAGALLKLWKPEDTSEGSLLQRE